MANNLFFFSSFIPVIGQLVLGVQTDSIFIIVSIEFEKFKLTLNFNNNMLVLHDLNSNTKMKWKNRNLKWFWMQTNYGVHCAVHWEMQLVKSNRLRSHNWIEFLLNVESSFSNNNLQQNIYNTIRLTIVNEWFDNWNTCRFDSIKTAKTWLIATPNSQQVTINKITECSIQKINCEFANGTNKVTMRSEQSKYVKM